MKVFRLNIVDEIELEACLLELHETIKIEKEKSPFKRNPFHEQRMKDIARLYKTLFNKEIE